MLGVLGEVKLQLRDTGGEGGGGWSEAQSKTTDLLYKSPIMPHKDCVEQICS